MSEECNTEAVIQQLEAIVTLKKLRSQLEKGKVVLPISMEAINAELDNQRAQMEETIAKCGGLENIPDQVLEELAEEADLPLETLESPEVAASELVPEPGLIPTGEIKEDSNGG